MSQRNQGFFGNRIGTRVERLNAMVRAKNSRRAARSSKRARGVPRNEQLPFVPPENWHEPADVPRDNYRIIVQSPGLDTGTCLRRTTFAAVWPSCHASLLSRCKSCNLAA